VTAPPYEQLAAAVVASRRSRSSPSFRRAAGGTQIGARSTRHRSPTNVPCSLRGVAAQAVSPLVLACWFGVSRSTITRAVGEVRPLLAARGCTVAGGIRLRTGPPFAPLIHVVQVVASVPLPADSAHGSRAEVSRKGA
jgi:hypothetical protein